MWEFVCPIGVQIVKKSGEAEYSPDDIYAISAVYYQAGDDGDETPCNRYIYFMKGNLNDPDSLSVRGNELILSNNNEQEIYLREGENGSEQL